MNYVAFNVGDKELKLKLDAKNTVALERVVGTNPLNELMKVANGQLPTLDFAITTLHASLQKLEHGYTLSKVYDLYDEYVEEGHSLVDLIPVLIDVFKAAGFIPKDDEQWE